MKKLLKLTVVLTTIVAFAACSGSSDNPKDVAKEFLTHLNKKEYEKAKALGTENTVQMIEMIKSFSGMSEEKEGEEPKKIENLACEVDGDKAVCTYNLEGEEEDKLELVKKDGKWLVDMKKENPMGDAAKEVGEEVGKAVESAVDSVVNAEEE
jgi:hypothetical protein